MEFDAAATITKRKTFLKSGFFIFFSFKFGEYVNYRVNQSYNQKQNIHVELANRMSESEDVTRIPFGQFFTSHVQSGTTFSNIKYQIL